MLLQSLTNSELLELTFSLLSQPWAIGAMIGTIVGIRIGSYGNWPHVGTSSAFTSHILSWILIMLVCTILFIKVIGSSAQAPNKTALTKEHVLEPGETFDARDEGTKISSESTSGKESIEHFFTSPKGVHPNLAPPRARKVSNPTDSPGMPSSPTTTSPSTSSYFSLQVGSFISAEKAQQAANQYLVELGEATTIHQAQDDGNYKVLLGQFSTEARARHYAKQHGLLPMLWKQSGG